VMSATTCARVIATRGTMYSLCRPLLMAVPVDRVKRQRAAIEAVWL